MLVVLRVDCKVPADPMCLNLIFGWGLRAFEEFSSGALTDRVILKCLLELLIVFISCGRLIAVKARMVSPRSFISSSLTYTYCSPKNSDVYSDYSNFFRTATS